MKAFYTLKKKKTHVFKKITSFLFMIAIDLVHDQVQESLISESRVIKRCQNQLHEAIRSVENQVS